jgi:hypothetical protein
MGWGDLNSIGKQQMQRILQTRAEDGGWPKRLERLEPLERLLPRYLPKNLID